MNEEIFLFKELSYKIKGAIYNVFKVLGPGLLEKTYESALCFELKLIGLKFERQSTFPITYRGEVIEGFYKADIIVEDSIIIEIKSVTELHDVHKLQLLNYLKISGKRVGFLVNFNVSKLIDNQSLIRIVN